MKSLMNICLLAIVLSVGTGCASSQYLSNYKSAQEAFNRAAAAGNQQVMYESSVLTTTSPESEYRTARAFILKAMGDTPASSQEDHSKTKLASDGLLLTAYNIRALSEWKLGMYSEALKTAKACRQTFGNDESVKQQRDYLVIEIMHALVYNDSIANYIKTLNPRDPKKEPSTTEIAYLKRLEESLDMIGKKRQSLEADNPLQTYLCITQLSIAKNWKNLTSKLTSQMKGEPDQPTWKSKWESQKATMNKELVGVFASFKKLLADDPAGVYAIWAKAHLDVDGIDR